MWNFGFYSFVCLALQLIFGFGTRVYVRELVGRRHVFACSSYGQLRIVAPSIFFALLDRLVFHVACQVVHVLRTSLLIGKCSASTLSSGLVLLVLLLCSCFLGYVCAWGCMSYWGATVILSLLGFLPGVLQALQGALVITGMSVPRLLVLHFVVPFSLRSC